MIPRIIMKRGKTKIAFFLTRLFFRFESVNSFRSEFLGQILESV